MPTYGTTSEDLKGAAPSGPAPAPHESPARAITIGLLGLGTVGSGVIRLLAENAERIEDRLGARLVVRRVAVRDPGRRRLAAVAADLLTTRVEDVIADPHIDILVELVGGVEPTREWLLQAIAAGKHVVTANKALLAAHGDVLMAAAAQRGVDLYYEAAVCGGIPIIRSIREALAADRIHALYGIINGTTNYILTEMTEQRREFPDVLRQAVERGYAEADPSLDVDGHDAAQKIAILAALAFGIRVTEADIPTEGISHITAFDIARADELGFVVKLLAIATERKGRVNVRVHPALLPHSNLLSHVRGVYNAVLVESHASGPQILYGKGAGMMPTASAVVSDVIEVSRNIVQGRHGRIPGFGFQEGRRKKLVLVPPSRSRSRFYFHFDAVDRPGVLGQIASILGEHHISIAQMKQTGRAEGGAVPVTMLTHEAEEGQVTAALERIDATGAVASASRFIRVVAPEVVE